MPNSAPADSSFTAQADGTEVHPGSRLKAFRIENGLSLREAARQLHVVHPALKEWEEGRQVPVPAYRDAIQVWTRGAIRAEEWPLSEAERKAVINAAQVVPVIARDVVPVVPAPPSSSPA